MTFGEYFNIAIADIEAPFQREDNADQLRGELASLKTRMREQQRASETRQNATAALENRGRRLAMTGHPVVKH